MSYLKNKAAYLSGPITYSKDIQWRDDPKGVLKGEFCIDLFDTFKDHKQQWTNDLEEALEKEDYDTVEKISKGFVRKDLSKVDHSWFLIAYCPHKIPTIGVVHEIINANNKKVPTLLVCPEGKKYHSPWYFGFIKHEFMFGSWDDLYSYLREVNDGKHMENNRWQMVYDLV